MAKQLLLIRHAKSSWDDLTLRDIERELDSRGLNDAPEMGRRLRERGLVPDQMLISPARRTRQTAALLAEQLGVEDELIEVNQQLYLGSPDAMLAAIRKTPDHINRLALVGHNPGLTELGNQLAKTYINNVPTCGMLVLEFSGESWSQAGTFCHLIDFDYPKKAGNHAA